MSSQSNTATRTSNIPRNTLLLFFGILPGIAYAAPGDLSFDFAAATPGTYDTRIGGGMYADGSAGHVVHSLSGADFTCGDQISYLTSIRVSNAPVDPVQSATLELRFAADTSANAGAGYAMLERVRINRSVRLPAGNTLPDSGTADDSGSIATRLDAFFVEAGTNNPAASPGPGVELVGHILVSDLEAGERVVIAFDSQLSCVAGTSASGALAATLVSARVSNDWASDVVSLDQTVSLNQVQDVRGTGAAALRLQKSAANPSLGCPGTNEAAIYRNEPVKYCYSVTNPGTETLHSVGLLDDAGTPSDTTDDLLVSLVGLVALDGDGIADDLPAGGVASGSAIGIAYEAVGGFLYPRATATGQDGNGGGLVDIDDAEIQIQIKPSALNLQVTASNDVTCGNQDDSNRIFVASGSTAYFCYTISNTGDFPIYNVQVPGVSGSLTLEPGQTGVLSNSIIVGTTPIPTGEVVADGVSFDSSLVHSNSGSAVVEPYASDLSLNTRASLDPICGNEDDGNQLTVLEGTPIYWCHTVVDIGTTPLQDVHVVDPVAPVGPTTDLIVNQVGTLVSDPTIANGDLNSTPIANAVDPYGNPVQSNGPNAYIVVAHPHLFLIKTASLDGYCPGSNDLSLLAGDTITWCYEVTNNGDTDIRDVVITDGDTSFEIGFLLKGESAERFATSTVANSILSPSALATGSDAATGTQVDAVSDPVNLSVIHPALSTNLTVSDAATCPGSKGVNVLEDDVITWCYEVTNNGDVPLLDVVVSNDFTEEGYVDTIDYLEPGETVMIPVDDVVYADILGSAWADGVDAILESPVTSDADAANINLVQPSVNVDVSVATNGSCPGIDNAILYTGQAAVLCYTVSNDGDTTVQQATVTDEFLGTVTTVSSLEPGAVTTVASGWVNLNTATLSLLPGYSAASGSASNLVTVTGTDEYGYSVSDDDATIFKVASTDIKVSLSTPSQVQTSVSTAMTATVTVTNAGSFNAANTVATVSLPSTLSYVSSSGASCTWSSQNLILTCALGTLSANGQTSFTVKTTANTTATTATVVAFANSSTTDPDASNNRATSAVALVPGATRTIGFYSNRPNFVQDCLTANGGVINLGFVVLRNETKDDDIDASTTGGASGSGKGDTDKDVETGLEMAMGIFKANIVRYRNNAARATVDKDRMQAGQQVLAAICNQSLLGATAPFTPSAAAATLAGTNSSAILALGSQADSFNNSGDSLTLGVDPGPANSKYAWDDPTDRGD